MRRVGVNILIVIMILVGSLLPFNIKVIKSETVGGNSPIIGVNINVIDLDYDRVVEKEYPINYYTITPMENSIWRCSNFNSVSNACLQWTNDYSSGNIPGSSKIDIRYSTPIDIDVTYVKYIYEYEFILDDNYVGSITMSGNYTYDSESVLTHTSKTYYVNGNSFKVSGSQWTNSWSVSSYNLSKNNNQVWYYPIESFPIINAFFASGNQPIKNENYGQYMYPMFVYNGEQQLFRAYVQNRFDYYLVFISNGNTFSEARLKLFLNLDNLTIKEYTQLNQVPNFPNSTSSIGQLIRMKFTINGSDAYYQFKTLSNVTGFYFMPIYYGRVDYEGLSTDFALEYSLDNRLLKNLDLLANGNTQSNNSVSNAVQVNQDNQAIFNQEEQIVNNQETNMNNKLNNLDISNKNNNLFGNSKFIASANWVKTQFNYLTNNNAFNYMITFSLVIGISLVIIGKLRG